MSYTILPSFTDLSEILSKLHSSLNASQTHGLLCGLISGNAEKTDYAWHKFITNTKKDDVNLDTIQQLFETSYHQMSNFSFEFSLLLPDDDADINLRSESLGLWCQGFLTGLKQSHVDLTQHSDAEFNDTLNDIVEIAQINYEETTSTEENESAYFELVEYVRLAVLMIFYELNSIVPSSDRSENDLLH